MNKKSNSSPTVTSLLVLFYFTVIYQDSNETLLNRELYKKETAGLTLA